MSPQQPPKLAPRTVLRVSLILVVAAALALATPANAQPAPAVITVDFHEDDMGFNVTSTKDISNVIVELCDGTLHKHDDLEGLTFNHTEDQKVVSVYVKSGNNGIEGNDPPGAGERFFNDGVDCDEETQTETETETQTTTGSESETETGSESETETEEIPFFGGAGPSMVALGALAAMGGAFLMMRRRL